MNTAEIVTKKNRVPTKSKVAAWWMLITGGVAAATCLALFIGAWLNYVDIDITEPESGYGVLFVGFVSIVMFIFYFLPGLIILTRGWGNWMIASGILSIAVAFSFLLLIYTFYSLIPVIAFSVPLILILSDHIPHKRGGDSNGYHMP